MIEREGDAKMSRRYPEDKNKMRHANRETAFTYLGHLDLVCHDAV